MYKCIKKLPRNGFLKTIWVGESINELTFELLNDEEKSHFEKDNSDENIADQIEENQEADDAADH
jgi:hypothetical protein